MRMIQRTLLHFAAFTALLLSLYPLLAMVYHYADAALSEVWLSQLYLVLTGWTALFHAVLIRRIYRKRAVIVNCTLFAAGIIFGAAAFFLTPLSGVFMGIISAAAVFAVYQAGAKLFFIEYDALTHTYVYVSVCVLFALTSAVLWFGDHEASFLWQEIIFLIVSGVFAAAGSFSGIESALQSQSDESESLPKGILSYNRLLLCGLGAGVLILVLLRTPIGKLLWTILKAVIHCIASAFFWFAGLFTGEEQETADAADSQSEIITRTAVTENEWITLICTLVLAGIAVFILVRYRERIISGLINLMNTLRTWIARIFGRSYEREELPTGLGYTDYHVTFSSAETYHSEKSPHNLRWRREYKHFCKMKPDAQKYRLGFSLLLYKLSEADVTVRSSATPRELLESIPENITDRSLFENVIYGYERVRYSEEMPENRAMGALEKLLQEKF